MTTRRVLAYDPLTGDVLGELPEASSLTTTRDLYGLPTGRIVYPWSGANRHFLDDPVEIGIERTGRGGGSTVFTEYPNSRYLLMGTPDNDNYTEGVSRTYNLIGLGVKLQWAAVYTPSPSDEPDGTPVRQMRRWTDKNVGQILGDVWTEQQALGFLPGLTKDWGFAAASDGTVWGVDEQIAYLEVPIEMSFWDLVQTFVERGIIEVWMNAHEFRVFIARTQLYRDLTIGNAPTGFYWGPQNGITKQTEAIDYINTCTDALVIGADGLIFTPHNFGSDDNAYYGAALKTANVPWAHTADEAHASVDPLFRAGANPRREITVEIDWDSSIIEPDLDFRIGDRVIVQKGDYPADPDATANFGEQRVLTITETDDKEGRSGTVTFASKLARLEILTAQRAARLSAGSQASTAGLSRAPGPDQREPAAPTGLTITTVNEAEETGRQRAYHAASCSWSGDAVPDPVTGQVDPIEGKLLEWQIKSDYTASKWQTYSFTLITDLSIDIHGLPADTTYQLRVRVLSFTGLTPSAWLTSGTLTVPADLDALPGPDELWDTTHRNGFIRTKRTNDAGAGVAYVSDTSENVLEFTSTTPEFDYGVGSKQRSFRRKCNPDDEIGVDLDLKYVGGSGATARAKVYFFKADGTAAATSPLTAISAAAATTSWARTSIGTVTAPSDAASFSVKVKAQSLTGGSALRIRHVSADRRTVESRVADSAISNRTVITDAVDARTITPTDPLTTKHTATGPLIQAAGTSSGFKASPTGFYFYSGGTAVVSFDGSGIYVKGTIETGSGLIMGGAGLHDIEFAAGYWIGTNGGYLEYSAGGSGHKFTGALLASGAITGSSTLQITGAVTFLGSAILSGLGSTMAFYGATPVTKPATNTVVMTNQATIIQAVNTLAAKIASTGLITNNIS